MKKTHLLEQDIIALNLDYIDKNSLNKINNEKLIYLQTRHSIATLLSAENIRILINELKSVENYEDLSYIHILNNSAKNINIIKSELNYKTFNL